MASENLELKPRITVIGVGGAGGNAVNNMIRAKLEGVEFVVANTDAQALSESLVEPNRKIQLGFNVTQGLGAGSKPDVGRASAEESHNEIIQHLRGSNMVFITGGMGGGTGTGSAPIIARAAREEGILTVGVVTKPFHFEGAHRARIAERGIEELQQHVDTLIIIPNQNLFRIANERTTLPDAFKMVDDVLYSGVRGITDVIIKPGLVNLDFADIRAVMAEMGKAMMGTGEAAGDRRALDAAEAAISNPLLDDISLKGAKGALINITGGYDITLYEVDEAANRIRDEVDPEANIIFGSTFDEQLNGTIRVSIFATGIGDSRAQTQSTVTNIASAMTRPAYLSPVPTKEAFTSANMRHESLTQPIQTQISSLNDDQTSDVASRQTTDVEENIEKMPYSDTETTHMDSASIASEMGFNESGTLPPNTIVPLHQPSPQSPIDEKAPAREQTREQVKEQNGEQRRPVSLFERFTGVSRMKASPTPPTQVTKTLPVEDSGDLDMLEIPAFLRRGS
jgi:cell division protein FtsZ